LGKGEQHLGDNTIAPDAHGAEPKTEKETHAMSKEKRTITNEYGKTITIMIDPENTAPHNYDGNQNEVEWVITPAQWHRLVRESDTTAWHTEDGATILWWCDPYAAGCRFPGRK